MSAPRVRSRSQEAKREAYRAVVLDCAEELFADGGIDAAKVEDIAAAAGIAPRTLYTVFAGKGEIVAQALSRRRAALVEYAAVRAAEGASAFGAVILGVRGASEFFLAHPNYLKMELHDSRAWADENASTSIAWYQTFEVNTRLFAQCIADGSVRPGDPKAFSRALLAIQQSQLAHWVTEGMTAPPPDVIAEIDTLLIHAFAADVNAELEGVL